MLANGFIDYRTANSPRLEISYQVTPVTCFRGTKYNMKNIQNQITILLIESNSDWLLDVYSVLQEAGYDVLIATGGDEGFCVARRVRPDLILCETAMRDISGIQLCYMIRADKNLHATPFTLIGKACDQNCDTVFEGFDAGADDYFEKNCNRQFLAAKITRLIALRRSEAELRERCRELHRSETHLTQIIEDASNLAAVSDPIAEPIAFEKYDILKPENFIGKSREPKKQLSEKNVDTSEIWRQALQNKEVVETNKFGNGKREKVYYEIVC